MKSPSGRLKRLIGLLAVLTLAMLLAANVAGAKPKIEYKNGLHLRLLAPNPSLLVGEGEFYLTAVANIDANCVKKRQITLYRDGKAVASGNTENYGNVTIEVGSPPPAGRYQAKMRKRVISGKGHNVVCGAAESKIVVVN